MGEIEKVERLKAMVEHLRRDFLHLAETYSHCRHGSIECFCTKEAQAIVNSASYWKDAPPLTEDRPPVGSVCPTCEQKVLPKMGPGDYSCATCGMGMVEPCEHWKNMIERGDHDSDDGSAEDRPKLDEPINNVFESPLPPESPSCPVCGGVMVPKEYKCLSCGVTTGVTEVRPGLDAEPDCGECGRPASEHSAGRERWCRKQPESSRKYKYRPTAYVAASPGQPESAEREMQEFEKWGVGKYSLNIELDGTYQDFKNNRTSMMFESWLAGRAALRKELGK